MRCSKRHYQRIFGSQCGCYILACSLDRHVQRTRHTAPDHACLQLQEVARPGQGRRARQPRHHALYETPWTPPVIPHQSRCSRLAATSCSGLCVFLFAAAARERTNVMHRRGITAPGCSEAGVIRWRGGHSPCSVRTLCQLCRWVLLCTVGRGTCLGGPSSRQRCPCLLRIGLAHDLSRCLSCVAASHQDRQSTVRLILTGRQHICVANLDQAKQQSSAWLLPRPVQSLATGQHCCAADAMWATTPAALCPSCCLHTTLRAASTSAALLRQHQVQVRTCTLLALCLPRQCYQC